MASTLSIFDADDSGESSQLKTFPFANVNDGGVRRVYGLPPGPPVSVDRLGDEYMEDFYAQHCNYFAAFIQRNIRISSREYKVETGFLSPMLDLPTELIQEIFKLLHPIDLYSLVRTTKRLRGLLLGSGAISVWRYTFRMHRATLPPCPSDLSEPSWASLLFGPATCDDCGRKGAMVDFSFRRRFCDICMDMRYMPQSDIILPSSNNLKVVELLWAYPRVYPDPAAYQTYSPRALVRDALEMARKIVVLVSNVESKAPRAEEEFRLFVEEAVASVNRSAKVSKVCNLNLRKVCLELENIYYERLDNILDQLEIRLFHMGYDQRDIERARKNVHTLLRDLSVQKLNPRVFRKLKPKLKELVEVQKAIRIADERLDLIAERQGVINDLYHKHQWTLNPDSWANLPSENAIYEYPVFSDYINSEAWDKGDFPTPTATDSFTRFLEEWTGKHQQALLEQLPSPPNQGTLSNNLQLERLDLATSIFTCPRCTNDPLATTPALVGWKRLAPHLRCLDSEYRNLSLSSVGYDNVLALVHLLGLNPVSTTIDELDSRNARFLCANCPLKIHRGIQGRKALRWLECVEHSIQMADDEQHATPSWMLLTPEATSFVQTRERPHPSPLAKFWICAHCPWHHKRPATKKEALFHVDNTHKTKFRTARGGIDVIFDRRIKLDRIPKKHVYIGFNPPMMYKCKQCPENANRLWPMHRLVPHLRDRHEIEEIKEERDCVRVRIIDRYCGNEAGLDSFGL